MKTTKRKWISVHQEVYEILTKERVGDESFNSFLMRKLNNGGEQKEQETINKKCRL